MKNMLGFLLGVLITSFLGVALSGFDLSYGIYTLIGWSPAEGAFYLFLGLFFCWCGAAANINWRPKPPSFLA